MAAIPYMQSSGQNPIYRFENESIQFQGSTALIKFGSSESRASWNVFSIGAPQKNAINPMVSSAANSSISVMKISNLSQRQVVNKYQNSVAIMGTSNNLKLAEIYNFNSYGQGISSNIVLKNQYNTTKIYSPAFSMSLGSSSATLLGYGKSMELSNTTNMGKSIGFNGKYSSISIGGVYISWSTELSIFVGGEIRFTPTSDIVILFFGPIAISPGNEYSIDPLILPMMFWVPPGGGWGTPPPVTTHSAPTINCFSLGSSIVQKCNRDCMNLKLTVNANSATVTYRAYEFQKSNCKMGWVNQAQFITASNGYFPAFFFANHLSAMLIDVVATNEYGTTISNPVNISVLNSMTVVSVYDSSSNYLAGYIVSSQRTTVTWNSPCMFYQTQVFEPKACSFYGSTLYPHGINSYQWKLSNNWKLDGNSQNGIQWGVICSYIAGASNSIGNIGEFVLDIELYAVNKLSLGIIPDFSTYGTPTSCVSGWTFETIPITYSWEAGARCVGGTIKHYDNYAISTSYPSPGGSDVLMFGTQQQGFYVHGNSNDYVEFAVQLQFIDQTYSIIIL
ncbi:MAG: hypothetical protein ACYCVP_01520 [Thermoplasmataceae archaeon]